MRTAGLGWRIRAQDRVSLVELRPRRARLRFPGGEVRSFRSRAYTEGGERERASTRRRRGR